MTGIVLLCNIPIQVLIFSCHFVFLHNLRKLKMRNCKSLFLGCEIWYVDSLCIYHMTPVDFMSYCLRRVQGTRVWMHLDVTCVFPVLFDNYNHFLKKYFTTVENCMVVKI
jgi:hypothetical protein